MEGLVLLKSLISEYREKEKAWSQQKSESDKALGKDFKAKADALERIVKKLTTDKKMSLSPETCECIMTMFSSTYDTLNKRANTSLTPELKQAYGNETKRFGKAWEEFETEKNKK